MRTFTSVPCVASLRAVTVELLTEVIATLDRLDTAAPIHIHIAEQTGEVDACLAWSGQRPVAWLLDHAAVDARWCLVHATHMDADEYRRAAASDWSPKRCGPRRRAICRM